MKYILLAYQDEALWAEIPASERELIEEACLSYEEEMWQSGYLFAAERFQDDATALTVYLVKGQVVLAEGVSAETKKQLVQLLFVNARDLNEAVKLVSKMPQIRKGPVEVRPALNLDWLLPSN